jgi:hypothetical protein
VSTALSRSTLALTAKIATLDPPAAVAFGALTATLSIVVFIVPEATVIAGTSASPWIVGCGFAALYVHVAQSKPP